MVAVTIVRCLLAVPRSADVITPRRDQSGFNRRIDGWLNDLDAFYARMLHLALAHRPTVFATGFGLFVVALVLMGQIGFEFQPQTDEGEVRIDAELAVGSRIERTEAVMIALEDRVKQVVPEATMLITQAGMARGFGNSSTHRGNIEPSRAAQRAHPLDEEISMQLRASSTACPA